nr:IS66 family transposase zinc-finger binding domain-containing protein [Pseudonocardia nigra]
MGSPGIRLDAGAGRRSERDAAARAGPCVGCGAGLADAPEVGVERRQVFDLPPITVQVTEHRLIARRCSCGATTCGPAPGGVTAPVQYGPRITAIILYLYVGGVPVQETHRPGAGRTVRHSGLRRHRGGDDPARRRRAGRVPRRRHRSVG